jgi:hypothetical protein
MRISAWHSRLQIGCMTLKRRLCYWEVTELVEEVAAPRAWTCPSASLIMRVSCAIAIEVKNWVLALA